MRRKLLIGYRVLMLFVSDRWDEESPGPTAEALISMTPAPIGVISPLVKNGCQKSATCQKRSSGPVPGGKVLAMRSGGSSRAAYCPLR